MIGLYRAQEFALKPVGSSDLQAALWIDVVAPTPEEVEMLHQQFDIDLQDIADCLDPNERARVEIDEDYDLLVLRSFLAEDSNGERIQSMPLGIFVTSGKVITVRIGKTFAPGEITTDMRRKPRLDSKEDLFIALIRRVNKDIEKRVRPIERTIGSIQDQILSSKKAEVAHDAFVLSNNLILLNTALLSNLNAISLLPRAKHVSFNQKKMDMVEDVENEVAQLYEMTTIYREITSNILNAYESAIANNLSTVMKILTTISLSLMLPTLLASLYGMNVELPFQHHALAFVFVIGLSVVSVVVLWALFRIKRVL